MVKSKQYVSWPNAAFIAVLMLGVFVITFAYRQARTEVPSAPEEESLTERHKELLSTEGDMSKWLLGLASGAFVSLVSIRIKDKTNQDIAGLLPMTAYAFLLLSLYGAFLSYDAATDIIRTAPLRYLYGDQLVLPVLIQFWTLVIALVLLGVWLFKGSPKVMLSGVIIMLFAQKQSMAAQTVAVDQQDLQSCVEHWYKDRLPSLPKQDGTALEVLRQLQVQPGSRKITNCIDADSVLDQLRFSATKAGDGLDKYLIVLHDELKHPALAMSDVVHSIVNIMAPWDQPLGVLSVHSTKATYSILINGSPVGLTNWSRRLLPGTYRIRVAKDYKAVFAENCFIVTAGETKVIDVDGLVQ